MTNQQVEFLANSADDQSPFPDRYNEFLIDTSVVFPDQPTGFYTYEVYEMQDAATPAQASPIETGRMTMKETAAPAGRTKYQPSTGKTFKVYNGN